MRRLSFVLACPVLLSGCATFSFAPPAVETDHLVVGNQTASCVAGPKELGQQIEPNIDGAMAFTNNFIRAYRCAARQAANGRQGFQVPAFLSIVGASVGSTFGASNDGILALAATAGVLNKADSYYAPKDKAAILDHAIDALLCIKAESVGVPFYDTTKPAPKPAEEAAKRELLAMTQQTRTEVEAQISANQAALSSVPKAADIGQDRNIAMLAELQQRAVGLGLQRQRLLDRETELVLALGRTGPREVTITRVTQSGVLEINVSRQYFEAVAAAVLSVERVLADRLSNAGHYDPEGITAEVEKWYKQAQDAKDKLDKLQDPKPADPPTDGSTPGAKFTTFSNPSPAENDKVIELSMTALQPALQSCVVRAKM